MWRSPGNEPAAQITISFGSLAELTAPIISVWLGLANFLSTKASSTVLFQNSISFLIRLLNSGAILNHSLLFERKAYSGEALEQLKRWADKLPIFHKVIAMRPKWGLDFSIDYVDQDGNAFEVLHWEYDGFDFDEVNEVKLKIEPILASIDYDDAAQELLNLKDQWHSLDFFGQSDWKCKFFGIPRERFKMVVWE